MEFTAENRLSGSKMRKEGSETRSHHRRSHRRSSSILKVPQSKLPLTDLDVNQQDDVRVPPFKKARKSENRRVSFADTCQIKEFPKDSPGAWHQENSSAENSPSLEETIEQEKPEISGLDKLLTGSIQHPGFSYAEEEVPLGKEVQSLGVQVDPVNHTLIVNDEMELTGVPGLADEPPDDFGEPQKQNNKVDYNFLRSLISSDKKANCSELHIEKPEKLFHVKSKESPETFVYTTMNRYSCLYEENIQSTLSVLTSGTTTLSDQVSMSSRAPLMAVSSSLKPGLNTTLNDVDSLGELESNLHVQTGAEKPKATGFLKSLLKSGKKDGENAVFFAQSSSSVSQHERTQIFGSGDGMDETAVLDNTIWTMEKRDLSSTDGLQQNHVTMEKISVESNCEKTHVFHSGDAMEETKVFTGTIWTKEEISVQEVEKTEIFDGNGKMDMMEETKVLPGGIWMGSDGKADVEVEKTKIFGMEDQMEETKVLTGGIWTGETKTNDKTRTVDLMEETKPMTGLIMFEHPNQSSNLERATKIEECTDKTKILAQDDMDETEVVSSSMLKTEKEDSLTAVADIGNNQNLNVTVSKEIVDELKEDDSDEEVTFNIKKTLTESEMLSKKDNTLKEVREQDPDTELIEKDKHSEVTVSDKDDGNTRSLADLKARLKEHTSRFDDTLLRPEERQSKTSSDLVISSQIQTNFSALDKKPQNETLMFSNKSAMLEETKMMTTSIEAVSQLPKKPQNQTFMFSNKSAMLEETKMVTTSIETGSSKEEFDMRKPVENQTVLFDDGNAMMEETKAVTSNLIIEPEPPSSAGASSSLVKEKSEMVDKLPTMAGGNMTVFFGNDTGAMEETKMATTTLGSLKTSSGKNDGLPLMDIPKLPDEGVISGSVKNTTRSDEKLEGLMETSMQGLLEQAPPESLLTDLTLNSTALSVRPASTSSQGVAASPIDSTQALLGKDWDNVTLPGNNSTLHGDVTFPRDSVMVTGEGEKSLISQLSINKTVDCDVTQEDIWEGPMTALSLCNYLHVIKPSCLKVSKVTELRKTRCSFIQEEDIPCEDLRSKLSALLTVQPHIEAQTEINAQLMAEVEKKKLELEAMEEAWSTEPPEIFQFAQTCSQGQKEELREKMMTMSNACTRRGKIEWKRATLQTARLELEKIQERNRRLNVEVEQTLQMATEAVQDMEQVSQELIAIEKEIQEMQNTPSPSEEKIQEYCVEKASLERKQSDLLNIKNEELNINEDNSRMAEECKALARRLSESVQLESERDNIQALENQSQKVGQEIQLLCGMSGWHLNEDSFKRNHKVFTLERNKLQLEVKHNEDLILSIEMRTCDTDDLSSREQFCYKLVTDAVNGQYLGQKYRQLSSLPKILQEVGSVVSHANCLQHNLLQLQLDHCIVFKYPSLRLEVWSPKKRCVNVTFLFQHTAHSLLWNIEPSLSVMHGNLRMNALSSQISQVHVSPENSYLNRVCAAVDLDSLPEGTHPKCSLCGTVQA